jgi:hypothetical protein
MSKTHGEIAALPLQAHATGSPKFNVDSRRLQDTLEKLSEFGRTPEGCVTRLGFSKTDLAAREYFSGLMKPAGLLRASTPAGNIFGLAARLLPGTHFFRGARVPERLRRSP